MRNIFLIILLACLISCKNRADKVAQSDRKVMIHQKRDALTPVTETADTARKFIEVGFTKPLKVKTSDELKKYLKDSISLVEEVDFTGDKIPDFICKMKPDSTGEGDEYWVTSNFKTIKKLKYYTDGFLYRWFINLDDDPEPEIFEAVGDEDGADYMFIDQNLKTGKDRTLVYVNPVIIENGKQYWGYPWDISDFQARSDGRKVELFCSLKHRIVRDGNEISTPPGQKQMPVIFFKGHHTQQGEQRGIKDEQWLSLTDIIKNSRSFSAN